jgi:hypothetical protein
MIALTLISYPIISIAIMDLNKNQINSIRKFQKLVQRRRLLSCMRRFDKMFYDTRALSMSNPDIPRTDNMFISSLGVHFDNLTNHIQRKETLNITSAILNRLYSYMNTNLSHESKVEEDEVDIHTLLSNMIAPQLRARDLLCAFCFMGFPEFTLQKGPTELQKEKENKTVVYDIYNLSKKVVGAWSLVLNAPDKSLKQNEKLRKFIKTLNMYANCFAMFMHGDRTAKVQEAIQRWYMGEKQKKDVENSKYTYEEKEKLLATFNNHQAHLVKMLKKINPGFRDEQLVVYKTLMSRVEDNIQKGFWNKLKDELRSNNYKFFLDLLKEIRDSILALLPKRKTNSLTQRIVNEFDEYFNMEYIKDMTDADAYSGTDFLHLADYLVGIIKDIQAPARTVDMIKEWAELNKKILTNELKETEDKGAAIIKFLLDEVQMVKDNILALKVMTDFGINVFN